MKKLYFFLGLVSFSGVAFSQSTGVNTNGSKLNAITTAVPFLNISPDARSGGMGEAGVAISPDANAAYWNPSKLAFMDESSNVSLSYSPWMRQVFPDVNLAYLSYFNKLDERNTIAASLRYFNLGSVDSYDANLNSLGTLHPNEYSFDVSLARKFGDGLSMGLTGRYIHSNLTQGAVVNGQQTTASNAVAADVSLYYHTDSRAFTDEGSFAFGVDISNIGTKMAYSTNQPDYFLPTNLRVGIAQTMNFDKYNALTFTFDVNKLLVPTPPIRDSNGNIIKGTDDNVSVVSGIFRSFTDAPGGFTEQFQEFAFSPGFEYWYDHKFALRMGYFYENPNKGDRQYATFGAGYRFDNINIDMSYIAGREQNTPLANVIRFSLGYSFGNAIKK
ncbi:MAG: type IX secretion system outer membrane channel protein PorV [Mucilaginibacter sp.]